MRVLAGVAFGALVMVGASSEATAQNPVGIYKGGKAVYQAGKGVAAYVAKSRAARKAAKEAANRTAQTVPLVGGAVAICRGAPGTQVGGAKGLKCAEKR